MDLTKRMDIWLGFDPTNLFDEETWAHANPPTRFTESAFRSYRYQLEQILEKYKQHDGTYALVLPKRGCGYGVWQQWIDEWTSHIAERPIDLKALRDPMYMADLQNRIADGIIHVSPPRYWKDTL
jgi:hypothetical protein